MLLTWLALAFLSICWVCLAAVTVEITLDAIYTLQDEYRDKHGIESALWYFYKYRKH